jgi:hypothetical protein
VKEFGDHLFYDATQPMPLLPSNPNNQRHASTGAQPNRVRAAEGKAGHLFHATSAQHMNALTHSNSNSQRRKDDSLAPKLFMAAADKASAISSVVKMANSQEPKPIRSAKK